MRPARSVSPVSRAALLLAIGLASAPACSSAWAAPDLDHAQKELAKEKLTIVSRDGTRHEFNVEMATAMDTQEVGLMHRPSVPENGGMLFVWDRPHESQMWMKNTDAALDMVFINEDGTIRRIAENTVPHSLAIIDSRGPVAATLELQGGITRKDGIRVGDKVEQRALQHANSAAQPQP